MQRGDDDKLYSTQFSSASGWMDLYFLREFWLMGRKIEEIVN